MDKGNDKVRPIAVGDTLRKTAIGIVLEKTDMSYFGDLQYGIRVSNGCEKIAHKTQILRDQFPHFDSVLLDATNAFNSIDRLKAAITLKNHFPQFFGYFKCFYGPKSHLWFIIKRDNVSDCITSEIGVQQGDVFSPFLFCLVIHPLLMTAYQCGSSLGKLFLGA